MAALETRAWIAASEDYYLCPLTNVQVTDQDWDQLLAPVLDHPDRLTPVSRSSPDGDGQPEVMAQGYETTVELTATVDQETVQWTERRLVVQSIKLARAAGAGVAPAAGAGAGRYRGPQ